MPVKVIAVHYTCGCWRINNCQIFCLLYEGQPGCHGTGPKMNGRSWLDGEQLSVSTFPSKCHPPPWTWVTSCDNRLRRNFKIHSSGLQPSMKKTPLGK
uniref:Uncharacterized protein n=1 Tax=Rhizophora mucronata TaxID=61149 RepID=A0A2P2NL51_RHIMU